MFIKKYFLQKSGQTRVYPIIKFSPFWELMCPPGKKRENPGIFLAMDFRPRWGVIFSLPPFDPTQDPKASSSAGRPHYYETPKNKKNIAHASPQECWEFLDFS